MEGYILGAVDFAGLILAITAVIMATRLVLRTENELDRAAKFLLADAVVLVLANLIIINNYFGGFFSENIGGVIFHASRIVALTCFISAMHYLIKITKKK